MQIKDLAVWLTLVKKWGCVRKQFMKKFGACCFLPYLCIVNQNEKLMTRVNK